MPRRNNQPKPNQHKLPSLGNTCASKQRFPTEKQARRAAETQMLGNMHLQLEVYHCSACQKWHLTSKPRI